VAARRAVIVDVVRSPFGKGRGGGALHGMHPVDLYAQVLRALVARTGIDPAAVDDVITGCVIQVGEQAGNIGRQAVLAAGLPASVPAVTIDRKCGSAQQAIDFGAQGIIAGAYDMVIAGGVEMMSTVPMRANRLGKDNLGPMLKAAYPAGFVGQGISAELIASRWQLSRDAMDQFSLASHQRAAHAEDAGISARSIVPIHVAGESSVKVAERDEGIRRDTTMQKLAALNPVFEDPEMLVRFPDIHWSVTAGNSSQVSDGASAVLIVEERLAARLNLKPRAAISHFAILGDDPILMLTAIIPATRKLLKRAGLRTGDIDAFEVNEAFASVVLAWNREFDVDTSQLNRYGGAIALGHPVGGSGGRLMGNLIAALEECRGRFGIQTMCESGGMANATLVERL